LPERARRPQPPLPTPATCKHARGPPGAPVTNPGTRFALTPTIRPKAASQEEALKQAGFTKVEVPETQLFPGEINRVSLYRKAVQPGERLQFKKMILLILADGASVREAAPSPKPDKL
jgi:hypothetical protein